MAEERNEIRAGNGRKVNEWMRSVSICLDDCQDYATKYEKNGKFYLRLTVIDSRQLDKYGKDVRVVVDTWKPDSTRKSTTEVPRKYPTSNTPENFVDDSGDLEIPF